MSTGLLGDSASSQMRSEDNDHMRCGMGKILHSFKHQPVGLIDLSLGYSFVFLPMKASIEDSN